MPDRLTIEEAATRLGVSARTVYRRIATGELHTVEESGRQWLLVDLNQEPPGTPGMQRLQHAADRATFDAVTDSSRDVTDKLPSLLGGELRSTIAHLEGDRDQSRRIVTTLSENVSRLADNVTELNRTLQGRMIRLAKLKGRILAPQTPETCRPPRRGLNLRERYTAWRHW